MSHTSNTVRNSKKNILIFYYNASNAIHLSFFINCHHKSNAYNFAHLSLACYFARWKHQNAEITGRIPRFMINSVGHVESIGDETFTNTEHKVHHKKLTHQRMIILKKCANWDNTGQLFLCDFHLVSKFNGRFLWKCFSLKFGQLRGMVSVLLNCIENYFQWVAVNTFNWEVNISFSH